MPDLTLTLTDMAHGGLALGRGRGGRAIFIPLAIPGETSDNDELGAVAGDEAAGLKAETGA